MGEGPEAGLLGEPTWAGAINLNSAIGCEQQRREDAKKARGNGKFGRSFAFTCQVVVSDFGEMASIALFSAFASSLFNCGIQDQSRLRQPVKEQGRGAAWPPILQVGNLSPGPDGGAEMNNKAAKTRS